MKTLATKQSDSRRQRGFFLIVVMLALVTIMLVYVMANLRILASLKRDIRIIEQKQVQRLEKLTPSALVVTNAPPPAPLTAAAP
jgi:hypothetical protein